jgi:hypothetical protein
MSVYLEELNGVDITEVTGLSALSILLTIKIVFTQFPVEPNIKDIRCSETHIEYDLIFNTGTTYNYYIGRYENNRYKTH